MVVEAAAVADKMGNEAKGAVLAPANICWTKIHAAQEAV